MRVGLYQCHPLPLDVAGNLQRLKTIASQTKNVDLLEIIMIIKIKIIIMIKI